MVATVFGIAVTIVIIGFLWFYIARPILEDFGIIGPRDVSYYQVDAPASTRVMSRSDAQTGRQTKQTAQTDADLWVERLQLDRTKTTVIELLVYSGWDVGEIRAVLKGDSGTLGTEIKAARQRLDREDSPPASYRTPIVGRPTNARFEADSDHPYEAPA